MALSALARRLINQYQGGFPLAGKPFAVIGKELGESESTVIDLVRNLIDDGYLSRFGPIYDASKLGGGQTLAALRVPDLDFARIAALVNAMPAVAHNYRREHELNMWFVVAAPTQEGVQQTLQDIEQATGLTVYNFPKQHEFYLGLWLRLSESGAVETVPVPQSALSPVASEMQSLDYQIIRETQAGLPLVPEPVEVIARAVEAEPGEVVGRMAQMLGTGVIRRIGAVPNHYRLGLRGNGMTVWDVPDDMAIELGETVGALDFVSHSYLRPRHAGVWPFNLFAMVHGRNRDEVHDKAQQLARILGPHCRSHDVLFSTQVLKKTGLRLAA